MTLLPELPDRLHAVTNALDTRTTDIDTLEVMSPLTSLVSLALGVRVREAHWLRRPDRREQSAGRACVGDLLAARSRGFVPAGDHSITLLRPQGLLAAADEVAASLAAMPSREGVLVIEPDDVLDAALARHDIPRLGAERARPVRRRCCAS